MNLADLIDLHGKRFSPVFRPALTPHNTVAMPLSGRDAVDLGAGDPDAAILEHIVAAGAIAGVGGYLERRAVYRDTALFRGDAERCIHIGVDVFAPAGVAVHAPLDGRIHSFANRQVNGDYGPVIIVGHQLDGIAFFTLYGHLATSSLNDLVEGGAIAAGQCIASIGERGVNGGWPPHLHFQLIADIGDWRGDYPGVVAPGEVDYYRQNCPDPTPLLVR